MSAPVDVLAVIDEAVATLRDDGNRALPGDLEIARAAVAELIEVAGSVSDAAVAHYGDAMGLHLALAATGGLNERLSAALAGVKGGAA